MTFCLLSQQSFPRVDHLVLCNLLLAFCAVLSVRAQAPMKLVFEDNFSGPANSAPDQNKWTSEIGGAGWGNKELEYYTSSTENAYLDGAGSLVIKAVKRDSSASLACWYGPCQYTSARLKTKDKFDLKYGRFESRIKIPRGSGVW